VHNIYIKKIIRRFSLLNRKCLNILLLGYKLKKNKRQAFKAQIKDY
jgi:hypothetical protein